MVVCSAPADRKIGGAFNPKSNNKATKSIELKLAVSPENN